VYAKNNGSSSALVQAYVICLSNANGSSTQILGQDLVPTGGTGHALATCPAGSIVTGGGYATSLDKSLLVYNSSMSGNGWQVYATNENGPSQPLNAYAICLSGTSGKVDQVTSQVPAEPGEMGHAVTTCPINSVLTGGGFVASLRPLVFSTSMSSSGNSWETYATNTFRSGDMLNSYAMCVKFQ
jgi:hypothetical protein